MIITGKINVLKIDKDRLYKGEKGTYLNFKIILNDEPDQYGNNGFVAEDIPKEEYEAGVRGEILGNVKIMGSSKPTEEDKQALPF